MERTFARQGKPCSGVLLLTNKGSGVVYRQNVRLSDLNVRIGAWFIAKFVPSDKVSSGRPVFFIQHPLNINKQSSFLNLFS
jgi:hypothetical protein